MLEYNRAEEEKQDLKCSVHTFSACLFFGFGCHRKTTCEICTLMLNNMLLRGREIRQFFGVLDEIRRAWDILPQDIGYRHTLQEQVSLKFHE